ncbi:glycerophosphodiester phosphodiesterase family protein [Novosphingobium sp.]|uniref:glycerophosphodiester phosphodiesterase family protein n=1 Tax=Novosphingobium sp. TaxID=1874826 RepID=UPI0025D596B3|nr:glycerophosphodiester phosphodiesterase family protein [Novosphingobium sp.]
MLYLLYALLDAWLIRPPEAGRVAWLREADYAHRGLHGADGVPENSPAAFARAIAEGLGIECDVQRTSDGQAVVFHDFELDRLTGESGDVIDHSAAQLGRIVLSGTSDGIPTLQRLLQQVGGRVPLLIEVKSRKGLRVAPLCLAVRRVLEGYRGPVAVMSFDPRVSRWFATHSHHVVHGLVVSERDKSRFLRALRTRMTLWVARPEFVAWDVRDLPSKLAAKQRKRGLPLLTWTVRDDRLRQRAERYADAPIAEGEGIA